MVKTKENMLPTTDARVAHTSANIVGGNFEILHRWLVPGVRSIHQVPIAASTVRRGSAVRQCQPSAGESPRLANSVEGKVLRTMVLNTCVKKPNRGDRL